LTAATRGRLEKDPARTIILITVEVESQSRSPATVVNVATPTSIIKMFQSDRVVHPVVDSRLFSRMTYSRVKFSSVLVVALAYVVL